MSALYNEIDPFAANWLEALAAGGHIASGRVERRSVADLKPDDVAGPGQRHFFAGIGGWSHALRLAGIADDADVWTGSCPCQGLSDAGKRRGALDPRHLWPAWFDLIRQCRPPTIFGEQVASSLGLDWLDLVRADLEGCGYSVGASDLCAAGVGAPHIRQRLYFVAYAGGQRRQGERLRVQPGRSRTRLEDAAEERREGQEQHRIYQPWYDGQLDHACRARGGRDTEAVPRTEGEGEGEGREPRRVTDEFVDAGAVDWSDVIWLPCSDGKSRPAPAEPLLFPLAHGVPGRVGTLGGSGNAIVPQVVAAFICAAEEARLI